MILVIIQIPGAAGLYPIEMMPEFFRRLKPFLPFTYGINAMRGPIGGMYANHYWIDMLSLFWYLPVALFIGLVVRKLALNLNRLFDNRLADTDLMITEHNEGTVEPLRLTETAQQIAEEFPELARRRAIHFFRLYPRLVRWGFLALAVLPFVFLLLLFITRMKLAMLLGWIISIIAIDTYLIVVEYLRERYANYLGEEAMSAEEFRSAILHENLLFRPACITSRCMPYARGCMRLRMVVRPDMRLNMRLSMRLETRTEMLAGVCVRRGTNSENDLGHLQAGHVPRHPQRDRVIVSMGLVVVPALYAWFNIAASWNPYGNTKALKVAVANNDKGYKSDLIPVRVNVGETIISTLHANDQLDWQFVKSDKAIDGVKSGEYYAAIVIPKGFSADMMTLFSPDIKHAQLKYYLNEKINPIAPHITDQARQPWSTQSTKPSPKRSRKSDSTWPQASYTIRKARKWPNTCATSTAISPPWRIR